MRQVRCTPYQVMVVSGVNRSALIWRRGCRSIPVIKYVEDPVILAQVHWWQPKRKLVPIPGWMTTA